MAALRTRAPRTKGGSPPRSTPARSSRCCGRPRRRWPAARGASTTPASRAPTFSLELRLRAARTSTRALDARCSATGSRRCRTSSRRRGTRSFDPTRQRRGADPGRHPRAAAPRASTGRWSGRREPSRPRPTSRRCARGRVRGKRASRAAGHARPRGGPALAVWQRPLEALRRPALAPSSTRSRCACARPTSAALLGEDRRAIAVVHDPRMRAAASRASLGIGKGRAGPGGPRRRRRRGARPTATANGAVHASTARPSPLPGWPAPAPAPCALGLRRTPAGRAGAVPAARDPIVTPPAVGDLDGDGRPEVVAVALTGRVYVFDADGRLRAGLAADARRRRGRPERAAARPALHPAAEPGRVRPAVAGAAARRLAARRRLQSAWDGRAVRVRRRRAGRARAGPSTPRCPPGTVPRPRVKHVRDRKLVAPPTLADLDGDGQLGGRRQEPGVRARPTRTSSASARRSSCRPSTATARRIRAGRGCAAGRCGCRACSGAYGTAQDFVTEGGDAAPRPPIWTATAPTSCSSRWSSPRRR